MTAVAQSLDELFQAALRTLPAEELALLQRAATVPSFDAQLYEQVLVRELSGPLNFEELVHHRAIQPVTGVDGHFEVSDAFREQLFNDWWPVSSAPGSGSAVDIPDPLQRFSRWLVDYYADEPLEQLVHLVAADRKEAAARFEALFEEAEAAFDLARCHALIRVLEQRNPILGPALARLVREKRLRLESRSLWAKEYYETIVYLEREQTRGLVEELLRGETREGQAHWILHIYARGGMGKTMLIRDAIARKCVEAAVPVARIDFDFGPDLASAVRQPWQLLLKIAEQLNPQIRERPFEELLRDFARFIPRTNERGGTGRRRQPALTAEEQERLAQEVPLRFGDAIEDVWGDRPFVVVFDTLENLRQQRVEMDSAFKLLNEIHQRCPGLRLLLSGRFNLEEPVAVAHGQVVPPEVRVPGFVEIFGEGERTVELRGFRDDEARDYLEQKRGLSEQKLVAAIVDKAQGNPFKLAILADVATSEAIGHEEIAAYPDADYAYLIERIINRIEERGVRWLLRYGVVPQRLTRRFMKEVMAPYLRAAMAGRSPYDDPDEDRLPEKVKEDKPFDVDREAADRLNLDDVWQRLYRYASNYSWVSVASDVPDAVVFHPDVAAPMRRLLRDHEIYQVLHRAAFEHYDKQVTAGTDGRYWEMREAVYHRYHMAAAGADGYWLDQLEQFSQVPEAVRALAEQVVALAEPQLSRYWTTAQERAAQAQQDNGAEEVTVDETVLAHAHFQLARLHLADEVDPDTSTLFRAEQLLRLAERLGAKKVVAPAELGYLWAQIWFGQGKVQEAIGACETALAAEPEPETAVSLRMLSVEAYRAQADSDGAGVRAAIDEAQAAVAAVNRAQRMPAAQIIEVQRRLDQMDAAQAEADENLEQAAAAYRRLLERSVEPADVLEHTLSLMRVLAAMGQEAAAQETGAQSERQLAGVRAAASLLRARAALLAAEPAEALAALQQLQGLAPDAWEATGQDGGLTLLALQAEVAAAVMDLPLASSLMQSAIFSGSGPESAEGFGWSLEAARLLLDETGEMTQVAYYLDLARDHARSEEQRWRADLLRARFLRRAGRAAEADSLVAELRARSVPAQPSLRLQRALLLLAGEGTGDAVIAELIAAAGAIEPPARRLLLLAERLRNLPTPEGDAAGLGQQLAALLPPAAGPGEDGARWAVRQAEVARYSGDAVQAQRLLAGVLRDVRLEQVPVWRAALQALDRTGWPERGLLQRAEELVQEASKTVRAEDPNLPATGRGLHLLYGVLLLEHAERLFRFGADMDGAQRALDEAGPLLASGTPWQAAMLALQGDLAAARGEREAAIDAYGQAIGQAESSGDTRTADELRARQAAAQAQEPAALPVADEEAVQHLIIRLQWDRPQQWHVIFERVTGPNVRAQAGDARTAKLRAEVAAYFTLERDEVFSYSLARAFSHEWEKTGRWLGELLFDAQTRLMLSDQIQHDIGLSATARELAWLPWEFWWLADEAYPHTLSAECRHFYRSIPPPTAAPAVEAGPARALILRAGEMVEAKMMRGYTQHAGVSLRKQYYGAGIEAQEFSVDDPWMLYDALSKFQPQLLHVVAGIREQRGHVFLDFAGGFGSQQTQVTAKDMAVALSRSGRAPLVILDVPAPPGETERVRQLLLRNAFAAELAQMAPVMAIIGTGLGDPDEQLEVSGRLVEGLVNNVPVGEIVRGMRQRARERWDAADPNLFLRLLPFVGTALFTADPQRLFALGR
ncbi:MAG: hypothetical protein RRC07_12660 [Anaerolineae bacterium]|nr:hypothetical protein [Anaerolineae bacterium]